MRTRSHGTNALRFILSIPIAFTLVAALQFAGVAGSCGSNNGDFSNCSNPPGGQPPPGCTASWTAYRNGYDSWTITEAKHEYRIDFTIQGYRTDSCGGGQYGLDTQRAHTDGEENCPPTDTQTDWDKTASAPGTGPFTLTGIGGYASGGCLFGHWITGGGQGDFEDAETKVR